MLIAPNARYLNTHEWARQDGDLVAVGLSAYAIAQLGDILYIKLPEAGEVVAQGQAFGVIEAIKSAVELQSPVAGKIVQVNTAACDNPQSIERDAYQKGWLVKLEPADPEQLMGMMDADAYRTFLESGL